jgi:hypothetical protein
MNESNINIELNLVKEISLALENIKIAYEIKEIPSILEKIYPRS